MATRLPSIYQDFIHISRYARFNDELGRRETWDETVDRYINYFKDKTNNNKKVPWDELRTAIINLEVMPSMRCLMTAGPALEKDQVAGYNCSYVAIDTPKAFDEIMYILMCGTGVGFSVESKYTNKLPEVPEELHDTDTTVVVKDSKIGWASAYREIVSLLYSGKIPKWDVSKVRPAGERLKTFGGRASGPEPLVDLFNFTLNIFKKARGRKMSTLECHDIVCKIADIVVCGGVRRSALISLTDLNDDHLRHAKSGDWWALNGQRALANISAVYDKQVDMDTFMNEWHALYMSKSGERGIFSRAASQAVAAKNGRRDPKHDFGTNPCSEIILRPFEFCNLSEIVVRASDDVDSLKRKARLATIIGTLQSTLTDFRYINKRWKNNCDEERLLGVSLTGICDNKLLNKPSQKLADALDAKGLAFEYLPGEGAFYGPKIEFSLKDCIGRVWQCGTIQVDFSMPGRLDAQYVAEDGSRQVPVMLHRAILGSFERFMGILIEHYEGAFPAWLAPEQVAILNITDNQADFVKKTEKTLRDKGFRVISDLRNEKIGFKIREHTIQRVPYLLVIGDKEVENNSVAVRTRDGKDLGVMNLEAFVEHLSADIARRGRIVAG